MAALPHIKREGRGALIHISSLEAKRSFPYHSAYAAAKHGIGGFLEALRVELKHEGWPISVTQVMPGTINTPLFDKARTKLGVKPVGLPPIYEPGVVTDVILYAAEHPARDLVAGGAAPGGRHPRDARGFRTAEDRRAKIRGLAGQPLRAHRRPRHSEGWLPGIAEEPLQLVGDPSYGERPPRARR
jgi:NAD(P)-dependent dehydrogenase (short-subunit alcohol dehydrogenase family)